MEMLMARAEAERGALERELRAMRCTASEAASHLHLAEEGLRVSPCACRTSSKARPVHPEQPKLCPQDCRYALLHALANWLRGAASTCLASRPGHKKATVLQELYGSVIDWGYTECSLVRPCCVTCRGSPQAAPRTAPPARDRASPMAHLQAPFRPQSPQPWASCTELRASRACWEVRSPMHVSHEHMYMRPHNILCKRPRSPADHLERHCAGSETPQYASPASKTSGSPSARRTPAQGLGAPSWTHSALKEIKVPQACPSQLIGRSGSGSKLAVLHDRSPACPAPVNSARQGVASDVLCRSSSQILDPQCTGKNSGCFKPA